LSGQGEVRVRRPVGVELRQPGRLALEVGSGPRERVAVEEPEGDRRRDDPGEDDAGEEERGKPEAERAEHGSGAACAAAAAAVPRGRDLVADPPDGHDRRGLAELAAELADVHVDGPRVAGEGVAPDALQELVAREDETAVVEELPEQVELLGRELDLLLADAHLAATRVHGQVAVPDLGALAGLARGRRAAQDRLHARDELAR